MHINGINLVVFVNKCLTQQNVRCTTRSLKIIYSTIFIMISRFLGIFKVNFIYYVAEFIFNFYLK